MSERGKFFNKKKFSTRDTTNTFGRVIFNNKSGGFFPTKSTDALNSSETAPKIKQPTILLKAREPNDEIGASPKKAQKDDEKIVVASKEAESSAPMVTIKQMVKAERLLEDGIMCPENLQEYLQENNDFLVVGVVGAHGVGKSTILNFLAQRNITNDFKKAIFKNTLEDYDYLDGLKPFAEHDEQIFKVQDLENIENNSNATHGIDMFVTSNRVILLDCQPFISVSVLEDLVRCENKRTSLVSEFIPLENSGEIQGLQLTAFLMSVCHILILVQDWFFDSNAIRFIQCAEMLKPTISNPEDELTDHFPSLLLLHNKAQMEDFSPGKFKSMQQIYKKLFHKSKLHIENNMGLGSGRIINYLNAENCGSPINLFLIPEIDPYTDVVYNGHPAMEDLFKKLRSNILGCPRNALTHVQLTEKTWLVYCTKVWETVKKSPFFVEYTKLMP